MPTVLNKQTDKIPSGAIYVGRPSYWGNPFVIGKDGDRKMVIEKYKNYISTREYIQERARRELKGKDLVCYCTPKPCHADVLLEIANATR